MPPPKPRGPKPLADWREVELLYVLSPEDVSFKALARRLGLNLSTFTTRATRGKWASKRAAAKAANPHTRTPDSPYARERGENLIETGGDSGESGEPDLQRKTVNSSVALIETEKQKRWQLSATEHKQSVALVQKLRGETYLKAMSAHAERLPELMAEMTETQLLTRAGDLDKLDKMNRRSLGLDSGDNASRAPLVQIALLSTFDRSTVPKAFPTVVSSS